MKNHKSRRKGTDKTTEKWAAHLSVPITKEKKTEKKRMKMFTVVPLEFWNYG